MCDKYIAVVNGPNLNLLGKRKPEVYGSRTLGDIEALIADRFPTAKFIFSQHNGEGEIIDELHAHGFNPDCLGIVLNAGAYTHYSHAIADAIEAIKVPVVEVHISQPAAREEFRHTSVIARVCRGSISGFGYYSYILAVEALLHEDRI